ncbi:cytochrome P450 [Ascobolus immersus RN42]|uniref:Cytochrome P450 n=1 Tax=Ascobolus immersus RN42 TaxID=1160509 RepID=A0A3N4I3D8_ASCIM|nr:cytochrome P450 [Ascobolus immersus RN42]
MKNLIIALVVYKVVSFTLLAIYRLTLHPLASFPGPFLARISPLYEYYFAFCKTGVIQHCHDALHSKYGPIIRTMPNEITINDPEAYHEIHYVGTKFLKTDFYLGHRGFDSTFGSIDPKLHRKARSNVAYMFARSTVAKHEPVVVEKCGLATARIEREIGKAGGKALVEMKPLVYGLLFDIVSDYTFGGKFEILKQEKIHHPIVESLEAAIEAHEILRYFPGFLEKFEALMPIWLADKLGLIAITGQLELRTTLRNEIRALNAKRESGNLQKNEGKPTVLSDLLDKGVDVDALGRESNTLLGAALDTTSWTIMSSVYQMAKNKDVQQKLYEALKELSPNRDDFVTQEQAESHPYVVAVLKEILRTTTSVMGKLPRYSPPGGATVMGTFIPEGTIINTSVYLIHNNPKVFANPEKFDPERWLQPSSKKLERYLVSFSAGTRACVGMHFAYLNLYVGIAALYRKFEFDLTEEMKDEGWLFAERLVAVKRGLEPNFLVRRRED